MLCEISEVTNLPLQCINYSNQFLCNACDGYSVWFAFCSILGIGCCKCHFKTDKRKAAINQGITQLGRTSFYHSANMRFSSGLVDSWFNSGESEYLTGV